MRIIRWLAGLALTVALAVAWQQTSPPTAPPDKTWTFHSNPAIYNPAIYCDSGWTLQGQQCIQTFNCVWAQETISVTVGAPVVLTCKKPAYGATDTKEKTK